MNPITRHHGEKTQVFAYCVIGAAIAPFAFAAFVWLIEQLPWVGPL